MAGERIANPVHRLAIQLAADTIGHQETVVDPIVRRRDTGRMHHYIRCGKRGAYCVQRSRLIRTTGDAYRIPRHRVVVELEYYVAKTLWLEPLSKPCLHCQRQRASVRSCGCANRERVEHCTIRPRGDRRRDDVKTRIDQRLSQVSEQTVRVAARDINAPVAPFRVGGHRDTHDSGTTKRLNEPRLSRPACPDRGPAGTKSKPAVGARRLPASSPVAGRPAFGPRQGW